MATLHIEHPITEFEVWSTAFDRFADVRQRAGVRTHRVQRPVDDPKYVVIDLDFDTVEAAEAFVVFLKSNVWGNPGNSPALAGEPVTKVLVPAGTS